MSPVFTLPNILSGTRILLVPVLLALAVLGHWQVFLVLLALSLLTDALDGYFARRFNQTSELGVKLDSWGDLLTYFVMAMGLWLLWPQVFFHEIWFLLMGVSFYCLPIFASLFKFGALPHYHTWAAKLAAVMIAPAYFALTLGGYSLAFRLVIVFHVWVAVEELLIVFILRRNRYNVPTLFHARNLSRRARRQFQLQKDRLLDKRNPSQHNSGEEPGRHQEND